MSRPHRLSATSERLPFSSRLAEPAADAPAAPTAPVSHRRVEPGAIPLEASFTRHTKPQGATFGDALRLLATWAERAGHASRRGDVQESPFCVADTCESE